MVRATADEKIRALSGVPLFNACTQSELRQIARLCTPVKVGDDFVLTVEGTPGVECFVIGDGKATVSVAGEPVGVVGPGESVGEMALLDRGPRSATVTATTPMTLYVLSTAEFQRLLDLSPTVTRKIAVTLAGRLRTLELDRPH